MEWTMKTVVREKYGLPNVLQLNHLEMPKPQHDEVLIRVHATTVNRTDCANLTGRPLLSRLMLGFPRPKMIQTGTDFAGEIVEIGRQVTTYAIGDRVWGFDDSGIGSQAEYVVVKAGSPLARIHPGFTYAQAAASSEGAHYALNFINKVNIKEGQSVFVNGATGAIGSALVQLLGYYGARITATCREDHFGIVQGLGANRVLDYMTLDYNALRKQFDFVFDAVGKSSFAQSRVLLKKTGIYISSELGNYNENPVLSIITPLFGGKKVKFPVPINIRSSLEFIQERIQENAFVPLIDRSFPLEDVVAAYEYVMSGQKIGNVILQIKGE
jgi:NADPH:quinone reductase-like Zn-dependent oxidoreductase